MLRAIAMVAGISLLAGACTAVRASAVETPATATAPAVAVSAPAPANPDQARETVRAEYYRLEPGDRLAVDVYPDKTFGREVVLDENGAVHLPLVGTLRWAGLTIAQISAQLEELLRGAYYRDPKVSISVVEYGSSAQRVYVFGEVKNPGAYNFKPGLTLLRVIALAGGFTDVAKDQSVELLRKRVSAREREERERIDIKDVIRGRVPDPVLDPDDVVIVPESFF